MHRAALDGHVNVVRALLASGKDRYGDTLYPLNAVDKVGDTPLHEAARNGHIAVVRELAIRDSSRRVSA